MIVLTINYDCDDDCDDNLFKTDKDLFFDFDKWVL